MADVLSYEYNSVLKHLINAVSQVDKNEGHPIKSCIIHTVCFHGDAITRPNTTFDDCSVTSIRNRLQRVNVSHLFYWGFFSASQRGLWDRRFSMTLLAGFWTVCVLCGFDVLPSCNWLQILVILGSIENSYFSNFIIRNCSNRRETLFIEISVSRDALQCQSGI